jgi:hypothetical protein
MKVFASIFCLFLSITVSAQSIDTTHKDTSVRLFLRDAKIIADKPLVVLNGYIYKRELNINSDSVFDIELLKGHEATDLFGSMGLKGVILIATKKFAIKEYQDKFSTLCLDYKKYLINHKNDDSDLIYVLGNQEHSVNGYPAELLKELYEIPLKKIKKVAFLERDNKYNVINHSIVVITTKK